MVVGRDMVGWAPPKGGTVMAVRIPVRGRETIAVGTGSGRKTAKL